MIIIIKILELISDFGLWLAGRTLPILDRYYVTGRIRKQ